MKGVSVLEIHSYEQILLLRELISTQQQNEAQRFKNNYFGIFSIRPWLESVLFLCQIVATSIRVLYRDVVNITSVYLPPNLVRSAGD